MTDFILENLLFAPQDESLNILQVMLSWRALGFAFWVFLLYGLTNGDEKKMLTALWTEGLGTILFVRVLMGVEGIRLFNQSPESGLSVLIYASISACGHRVFLSGFQGMNHLANVLFCTSISAGYSVLIGASPVEIVLSPVFVCAVAYILKYVDAVSLTGVVAWSGTVFMIAAMFLFHLAGGENGATETSSVDDVMMSPKQKKVPVRVSTDNSGVPSTQDIPGFSYLQRNEYGYCEYRHDTTGIAMVLLPGGAFAMGAGEEEHRRVLQGTPEKERKKAESRLRWERPVHEVELRPFLIAKYELTRGEWAGVMKSSRARQRETDRMLPQRPLKRRDCKRFCKKTGLSIPTEAQWEYACRAGTSSAFAFGDRLTPQDANFDPDYDTGRRIRAILENRPDEIRPFRPVGSYRPNGFGLYDMHGNVAEICQDNFIKDFYSSPKACGPDPLGKVSFFSPWSDHYVTRGGSVVSPARACRSASRKRGSDNPTAPGSFWDGFRPVFPLN